MGRGARLEEEFFPGLFICLEEDHPRFSAVVVFWEGSGSLSPCLEALRRAESAISEPLEIIVINNGAEEERFAEAQHLADRWIRLANNQGPSVARNLGARQARGELVAFIDDDGLVEGRFFLAALPYFEDPEVMGLRGRLKPREHPYFSSLATHYDRGEEPLEDALITEGATIVRREPFLECGGFPERVYGHEGIQLTYRLQRGCRDRRTLYAPDVVLYHDYLCSWGEFWEKMTRFSKNEHDVKEREPGAAQYLSAYFGRAFPAPALGLRYRAARAGLRLLRSGLQAGSRKFYALQERFR